MQIVTTSNKTIREIAFLCTTSVSRCKIPANLSVLLKFVQASALNYLK